MRKFILVEQKKADTNKKATGKTSRTHDEK